MASIVHKSVSEFRSAVSEESDRLSSFCLKWKEIQITTKDISEDIIGDINVAIGQADLLKKERFSQFSGLIDNCESGKGEKKITIEDLQGFWDIVYFQIDDIVAKFISLEKLRTNNWLPEAPTSKLVITKPALKKKPACVKKPVASSKPRPVSSLRAHILAARNKLNQESSVSSDSEKKITVLAPAKSPPQKKVSQSPKKISESKSDDNKENVPVQITDTAKSPAKKGNRSPDVTTFDAGFFKIETPSKSKLKKAQKTLLATPKSKGPIDAKVLSSSLLKERVKGTPRQHKDYSPCMRITRSMKKLALKSGSCDDLDKLAVPLLHFSEKK